MEEEVKGQQQQFEEIFEIEDMSSNGTFLNGVKLQRGVKTVIRDGDEIGVVVMFEEERKVMKLGYIFRDAK